ncbi:hypothetical protein Tco_0179803 [Tanacetum coccineum]
MTYTTRSSYAALAVLNTSGLACSLSLAILSLITRGVEVSAKRAALRSTATGAVSDVHELRYSPLGKHRPPPLQSVWSPDELSYPS